MMPGLWPSEMELLKKTGAGNLFMVFGEPAVKLTNAEDGTVTIELLGLDV